MSIEKKVTYDKTPPKFIKEYFGENRKLDKLLRDKAKEIGSTTKFTARLLRDKAKEIGSTTKFTASEAADAFNYMAMAGWKTEDMIDGIEGIMKLAMYCSENLDKILETVERIRSVRSRIDMTRVEENRISLQKISEDFDAIICFDDTESGMLMSMTTMLKLMIDISRSLAVIADELKEIKEKE